MTEPHLNCCHYELFTANSAIIIKPHLLVFLFSEERKSNEERERESNEERERERKSNEEREDAREMK